ncbi:MAG: antibiotic biosynthesis monooxygenase [Betaproteobacteria bacterium]|nr:MAG: antibiotic biosynthesis monooxygenase [Betaproteobacteria bacterium]
MIAVIFEVEPTPEGMQQYLDLAASLRPELEKVDGFISVERFESMSHPGKLVSLSFWRDHGALDAWRRLETHRVAQRRGRQALFGDYRLRVAEVVRDYGMHDRSQAPADSRAAHDREG